MALVTGSSSGLLRETISQISRDKNLDKSIIIDALEQAMLHAARKEMGNEVDLEAVYNEEIDEIELFQYRTVVANDQELENEALQINLSAAINYDHETEVGDAIGIKLDTSILGRIAAQAGKQIIVQKVRDAERAQIYNEFKDKVGDILSGYVRRIERNDIIVDTGRSDAIIYSKEQMQGEKFRLKDRIQGYVADVKRSSRGPQIILSRAHSGFLIKLFEQHVPEIYDNIVVIESAARDAGLRSKVAVHSKDASVDPVGACVGMKGVRVQTIVQELNGEKIDIVPWDKDPAKLVCNALAPAVVGKVIVDEEQHRMEVIVAEDQLSLAIGKRGQNVRLAAQLTGWKLDIKSEAKLEEQLQGVKNILSSIEGLGDMHVGILIHEGIKTPEDLGELNYRTLMRLLNLDEENSHKIIEAAKVKASELVHGEIKTTEEYSSQDAKASPAEEKKDITTENRDLRIKLFMALKGVGEATAHALADTGYVTIGDILADSAEEVAQKADISLGVARTVQIAADRYLQGSQENDEQK
jgi:transcription termination/antitermination protein NusA